MINRINFNRILSARSVTLRNMRTVNLISPVWKFVEKDALDSQQVNCKHCDKSWVNLNGSTTILRLHVMKHHIHLLTESEKQTMFGQCSGGGSGSGSGGGRGAQSTPLSATPKTMFACEDDEPNGVKDLDSELDLKLKLDSEVKQSNSSTENENHDSSDAIYNVKVTEGNKPWACIRCPRTFISRVNFAQHLHWHRTEGAAQEAY